MISRKRLWGEMYVDIVVEVSCGFGERAAMGRKLYKFSRKKAFHVGTEECIHNKNTTNKSLDLIIDL